MQSDRTENYIAVSNFGARIIMAKLQCFQIKDKCLFAFPFSEDEYPSRQDAVDKCAKTRREE